ncbi:cytochrome c oxidase assembly protein [Hansschlegelia plantiphila]|uniref:Cytochrome c oxidase assembly protein CtaG n=1 Tax=Hansschlegelia plantiphila TaxID=374655 RepID=A0A9W6MVA0_9HYPH|nr:cytochrome c oxidase assembly protein [Hansschlegelia plantiphila]GLK67738.1 cytochrome c oxidase assembly protein CtaG [Hansschlegelia plantiphila]
MTDPRDPRPSPSGSNRRHAAVGVACAALVAAMVGASYAAVPLYNMFCRATGYGGTTQVAEQAPKAVLDRVITVRFDGNVSPGLPWKFGPEANEVKVKIGETKLALFKATNVSDRVVTGTASYNVTPDQMGAYFSKIQCFCFTQQTLQPGESIDMPVVFFVYPSIADDPQLDKLTQLTLSYTFYPDKGPKSASAAGPERPKT